MGKDWTATNRKWLRQRRKDKNKEKGEPVKTTENNSGKANWLMNFARDLKPDKNLKNDGDLIAVRSPSFFRFLSGFKSLAKFISQLAFPLLFSVVFTGSPFSLFLSFLLCLSHFLFVAVQSFPM